MPSGAARCDQVGTCDCYSGNMKRPLIIAHRGASFAAPENTAAAFQLASAMGADGFECDVRLSQNAVAVVIHDADLKRLAGVKKAVGDLSLVELKALDIGRWFSRKYAGQHILTLEETLALSRKNFSALVEVKAGGPNDEQLAIATARLLARTRFARACSFSPTLCATIRKNAPDVAVDLVCSPASNAKWAAALLVAHKMRLAGLAVNHRHLSQARVTKVHELGLSVGAWTVNHAATVAKLARWGVDAIETDKPDMALRALLKA